MTAEVCDSFLSRTGLPARVMQPAFGMAECCTCCTYNHAYASGRAAVCVAKHSLQAASLRLYSDGSAGNTLCHEGVGHNGRGGAGVLVGGGEGGEAGGGDGGGVLTSDRGLDGGGAGRNLDRNLVASFVDLGPPSPGVEIRICAGGGSPPRVLRELQVGHLQIRGACVMRGYHEHPTATAESMVSDGWLETGDLGFMEHGRLVLTGRAKEMVIVRGANFYCYEVEDAAAAVAERLL